MLTMMRWGGVGALAVVTGCLGFPPQLPAPLDTDVGTSSSGTTGVMTSESETTLGSEMMSEAETTEASVECGDEIVEADEECDGAELSAQTCEGLGHVPGSLGCDAECRFDVSGCAPEGMVIVPGGEFEMGSMVSSDEQPRRRVQVSTFYVDQTEVTAAAYSACVADGACAEPGTGGSCNWSSGVPVAGRENHPVNCVTWFQAQDYCGWVDGRTKRLPTEAEWEKAARGTDARTFPWGDIPDPSCSHAVMEDATAGGAGCGSLSTMEVASKPLGMSSFGAADMVGNAAEWVADWYEPYAPEETDNPTGPVNGSMRVLRGGSWRSPSTALRVADRASSYPTVDLDSVGFRCARTPPAAR